MIVPQHWAEARAQGPVKGRRATVRRFGWSDISEADARAHADARAREALQQLAAGDAKLLRREPRIPYNGAEGIPIREEIISRHGPTIITRNSYGALCLNTPDVLFIDVDLPTQAPALWTAGLMTLLGIGGIALGVSARSFGVGLFGVIIGIIAGYWIAQWVSRLALMARGGRERATLRRIRNFASTHPDWHLRVYRTPAGFRVMVLHRTFDPLDDAVSECFQALGADPTYVRMCRNQRCFRARVSPKPWRIGIESHMKPRPGVWPVHPDRLPLRQKWVAQYQKASSGFASCRYMETLGNAPIHAAAAAVQTLHDDLSRAHLDLPMG